MPIVGGEPGRPGRGDDRRGSRPRQVSPIRVDRARIVGKLRRAGIIAVSRVVGSEYRPDFPRHAHLDYREKRLPGKRQELIVEGSGGSLSGKGEGAVHLVTAFEIVRNGIFVR